MPEEEAKKEKTVDIDTSGPDVDIKLPEEKDPKEVEVKEEIKETKEEVQEPRTTEQEPEVKAEEPKEEPKDESDPKEEVKDAWTGESNHPRISLTIFTRDSRASARGSSARPASGSERTGIRIEPFK